MAYKILFLIILPVIVAVFLYHQLDNFEPVPFSDDGEPIRNRHIIPISEKIGSGQLLGPEDIAYDPITGIIYTGTADGWINRVTVTESAAESKVERWVNTGGRPLGLAHGHHGEVIVADSVKGLINVSRDGAMELLTNEAEGLKFKLTDAVAISLDGILYFTDASYKYTEEEAYAEFLEGKPYGRFLSYDPSTKETKVLLRDLYFANGVAISPDQTFVIVCETMKRRCKRYYIKGEKKGLVDTFIENLPGRPDNIRYDGEGKYWIALFVGKTYYLTLTERYPLVRKVMGLPKFFAKYSGVFVVDLEGKRISHYYDQDAFGITSGIKIGDYLYCGSIYRTYIMRVNIKPSSCKRSKEVENSG